MPERSDRKILIAPSLLAADFGILLKEAKSAESAGADWLHIDVMDGHFVPNITIGPCVVASLKGKIKIPLDVHLMIAEPLKYAESFAKAGSDIITFHIESCDDPDQVISRIRGLGLKAGVSIKPKTGADTIFKIIDRVDMVLVMTVEPGFGGQSFIEEALPKITEIRKIFKGDIEVDGGIDERTAAKVIKAGANILVAGTAVFGNKDYRKAISALRG